MILKSITIILNSYLIITKKLLVTTGKHPSISADERIGDESYDDYMADAQIQTVNVGDPVDLKCNSPKEFAACFFSKTDEFINYRIQPNSTFPDKRLQCLCDHDQTVDPQIVCGLHIKEVKREHAGEWKCEVEITDSHNSVIKISAMVLLNVIGQESTTVPTPLICPPPPPPPPPKTTPPPPPQAYQIYRGCYIGGGKPLAEKRLRTSEKECNDRCSVVPECRGWTYRTDVNTCWLYKDFDTNC